MNARTVSILLFGLCLVLAWFGFEFTLSEFGQIEANLEKDAVRTQELSSSMRNMLSHVVYHDIDGDGKLESVLKWRNDGRCNEYAEKARYFDILIEREPGATVFRYPSLHEGAIRPDEAELGDLVCYFRRGGEIFSKRIPNGTEASR